MAFVLGFFAGFGAAGLVGLLAWTVASHMVDSADAAAFVFTDAAPSHASETAA
jgi:hypothetical protein